MKIPSCHYKFARENDPLIQGIKRSQITLKVNSKDGSVWFDVILMNFTSYLGLGGPGYVIARSIVMARLTIIILGTRKVTFDDLTEAETVRNQQIFRP